MHIHSYEYTLPSLLSISNALPWIWLWCTTVWEKTPMPDVHPLGYSLISGITTPDRGGHWGRGDLEHLIHLPLGHSPWKFPGSSQLQLTRLGPAPALGSVLEIPLETERGGNYTHKIGWEVISISKICFNSIGHCSQCFSSSDTCTGLALPVLASGIDRAHPMAGGTSFFPGLVWAEPQLGRREAQ